MVSLHSHHLPDYYDRANNIINYYSDLFHPDNIKNKHQKQKDISISLY